jgi:hemerythrin
MLENHAWNEKLDVGDGALDHDHHTQMALLGALAEALEQGRPALARRLGEELSAFSRAHFRTEELLMEVKGFRDAPSHAGEHEKLLARIDELNTAHASGNDELALSLAIDFRGVLAAHMNDADRRVAQHLAGKH